MASLPFRTLPSGTRLGAGRTRHLPPQEPLGYKPGPTAAFKSGSARLPDERSDAPPCTAYDPQAPVGFKSAGAAFKSGTARLPDERSDAPPCTAYDPQQPQGFRSPNAAFKSTSPATALPASRLRGESRESGWGSPRWIPPGRLLLVCGALGSGRGQHRGSFSAPRGRSYPGRRY